MIRTNAYKSKIRGFLKTAKKLMLFFLVVTFHMKTGEKLSPETSSITNIPHRMDNFVFCLFIFLLV